MLSLIGTARAATVDLVDQVELARLERSAGVLDHEDVSVAQGGDVDGDGLGDLLLVGADAVYVVQGRPSLRSAPRLGFRRGSYRVVGRRFECLTAAAPAGDVNGDGLADIIVMAPDEHAFDRRIGPRRRRASTEPRT